MFVYQLMSDVEMYYIKCLTFSKSEFVASYYERVFKFITENKNMDEVGLSQKQMVWLMKIKKDLKLYAENRKMKKQQLGLLK